MNMQDFFPGDKMILTEGAVVERLRRNFSIDLDPHILHAGFVFDALGREALASIYREYLDIGQAHDVGMVSGTPTWRANPERVRSASRRTCTEVNREAAGFIAGLRSEYGGYGQKISICGLLGCRGDAYDPGESLSEEEAAGFHQEQVRALSESGVDFLLAATLPSATEACGMARTMSACGTPYVLSFIIRSTGALLDGTPLHEAVSMIDALTDPAPLCYWINCVHPSVFAEAMRIEAGLGQVKERVIGLQANTSPLPPEELDNRPVLEDEGPSTFAGSMAALYQEFGTRVLGGCCGSDGRHIRKLAQRVQGFHPDGERNEGYPWKR